MIRKNQWPILITNIVILFLFSIYFILAKNYEFILYVGVIIAALALIIFTNKKVNYSNFILWGLTLWGFLHLAGGSFRINGAILYKFIIFPLSTAYPIFRYDQFVHIIGFGVATLLMFEILKPLLNPKFHRRAALSIVVVMAGLGVGALNEIIEFMATVLLPNTNVGGYLNTSLDLVADLIGALIALVIINLKNPFSTERR